MARQKAVDADLIKSILAEYGEDVDDTKLQTASEKKKAREGDVPAGTLLVESLRSGVAPASVICVSCGRTFGTNFVGARFCSYACMARDFKRHFGVEWEAIKPPPSEWQKREALTIPPDLNDHIYEWAKAIVAEYESTARYLSPVPGDKSWLPQRQPASSDTSFSSEPTLPTPDDPLEIEEHGVQASPPNTPVEQERHTDPYFDFSFDVDL